MRFGVQTVPQNVAWRELREIWRFLDGAGFDSAWTFDHFYPIFSDPKGPCLEGWIALAGLLESTSRIRGGVLVTGNTYRHPALLANMAATLDHVSGGRLNLGIGAAWFEMEHQAYGIAFPPVGERIARLDEACEIIRSLFTCEETTFIGRYYMLKDARCEPKTLQKPHPPIMIGGGGEKKTLRVVAKHADMWNWFGSVESLGAKIEILKGHCRDVGRKIAEIELTWGGEFRVVESRSAKKTALEEMAKRRNQSPEEVESLCLVGEPSEIADRIRAYSAIGIRHFLLSASAPYDRVGLALFSEKVIPLFR